MMGLQNFALLVFTFLVALLMPALPLWLAMASLCLGIWKWWIIRSGTAQPSRLLVTALGTLMLALIFLDSAPIFSRESMIALVCMASILFILDRPHLRQVMLVHGSFYGLLIALLVMRGAPLPLFLYFFLTVLIFFSLLIHHLPPSALLTLWPLGRNIVKIAAPVAAILLPIYFFFPEFRPKNSDFANSGLADSLEPGRIARLVLSDRVAFRLRFLRGVPQGQALYWRSTVLEDSFGMTWRKKRSTDMQVYVSQAISTAIVYEMIPEVRLGIALPLLERAVTVKGLGGEASQVWWNADLRMYQSQNDIIVASAALQNGFIPFEEPSRVPLELQTSDRVRALVNDLKKLSPDDQVRSLEKLFKHYTYTLKPGTLQSEDPLDDFLFNKQRGFCEHFAAAFATLLQLAGTPARVITGYEGGVPIGGSDFFLVRDSDAHAWTEVYLRQRWQRIDPSAFAHSEVSREPSQVWVTALPSAWFAYGLRVTVVKLREWAQEFEYLWMSLIGVLAVIVPLQIWRMQQKRLNRPVWQTAMDRFLLDLEKRGIKREKHEGMQDFLKRVAQRYPTAQPSLSELSATYQSVLYGPTGAPEAAIRLRQLFKAARLEREREQTPG